MPILRVIYEWCNRLEVCCGMSTDMIRERGERPTLTEEGKQTDEMGEDRGEDSEQLLFPGIPDAITVNHIFPKLLTLFSPILSLVSSGWRKAIQSEEVYYARARSHPTETLVVLNCKVGQYLNGIALYSRRDKSCYQLPPIPDFECRFPWSCQCISLDREIYIIGGEGDLWNDGGGEDLEELDRGVEVYVLNLARSPLEWKRCADMQQRRKLFGCGVKDGKIYVFGGIGYAENPLCESEVYDPKTNAWVSIPPMQNYRYGHHVARLGEELVVYGGCQDDVPYNLEFYNPGRNEWRIVHTLGRQVGHRMFMAQEKFYALTSLGIDVHDDNIREHLWTEMHSFTHPAIQEGSLSEDINWCPTRLCFGERLTTVYNWCPVLAVNDELLSVFHWHNPVKATCEACLLQSKGFGSKNKELVWEKVHCSLSFDVMPSPPLLCLIEL